MLLPVQGDSVVRLRANGVFDTRRLFNTSGTGEMFTKLSPISLVARTGMQLAQFLSGALFA